MYSLKLSFELKERTKGTQSGLGLTLVKESVISNGGIIKVESELNIVTKFHVVFPYQR